MSDTPELDRQAEVLGSGKAFAVQEFIDWLEEEGWTIAEVEDDRLYPVLESPQRIMEMHFGIDPQKIEAERRMLLSHVRNANARSDG